MATSKKITTNRSNAQKSTGPKTRAGKSVASQNARQHGVLSRQLVLPHESQADFDQLLQQLMSELQPVGVMEQLLVERIAVAVWRQKRLNAAEQATLREAMGGSDYALTSRVIRLAHLRLEDNPTAAHVLNGEFQVTDCKEHLDSIERCIEHGTAMKDVERRHPVIWAILVAEAEATSLKKDALLLHLEDYVQRRFKGWMPYLRAQREIGVKHLQIAQAVEIVRMANTLPEKADMLMRYQSSLDNDWFKAMRALREVQRIRREMAALEATPVSEHGE